MSRSKNHSPTNDEGLYIKDKDVRQIWTRERIKELGTILPDGSFVKNSRIYCFEYENSSRGLIYHVAKYQQCATRNPSNQFRLILVRSQQHVVKHARDAELARFLLRSSPPNLKAKIFECQGPEFIKRLFYRLNNS